MYRKCFHCCQHGAIAHPRFGQPRRGLLIFQKFIFWRLGSVVGKKGGGWRWHPCRRKEVVPRATYPSSRSAASHSDYFCCCNDAPPPPPTSLLSSLEKARSGGTSKSGACGALGEGLLAQSHIPSHPRCRGHFSSAYPTALVETPCSLPSNCSLRRSIAFPRFGLVFSSSFPMASSTLSRMLHPTCLTRPPPPSR